MKNFWIQTLRRLAASTVLVGATLFSSAMTYAINVALDTASDPVYDDGWQAGDNGGFGFGGWDFTGTYNTVVQQTIDTSSPPNNLGRAWTLYNADAPPGPGSGTDVSTAGRSIIGGLLPGQTVHVVVDNPTRRQFFRGYTVRFNTGGGNTVYAGTPQSRLAVGTFEYFTNGQWYATGTGGNPDLIDTDTNGGLQIDFALTSADTFDLTMTPLDDPSNSYSKSGTLEGSGTIDWIEFEIYNTDSDFYPSPKLNQTETDFYIQSMWISAIPEPSTLGLLVLGAGLFGVCRHRKLIDNAGAED